MKTLSTTTSIREILVPPKADKSAEIYEAVQGLVGPAEPPPAYRPSLVVERLRTVKPHGLTADELARLSGSVHFMRAERRQLWWVSVRGPDGATAAEARHHIATAYKRIDRLQRKARRLPQHWVLVLETHPYLHGHIIFVGNKDIARRLRESPALADFVDVGQVTDPEGLTRHYLVKERTPQTDYKLRHMLRGARKRGSHRLPGGGDRVRLSEALKRDAIAAGLVEPWQKTNAKVATDRKPYRLRRLVTWKALKLSGQGVLFELPDPTRLRCYFGGTPTPAQASEIEWRRRQHGLSQRELAQRIGLKQPHYANVIARRDPLSRQAANRLRAILLSDNTVEKHRGVPQVQSDTKLVENSIWRDCLEPRRAAFRAST